MSLSGPVADSSEMLGLLAGTAWKTDTLKAYRYQSQQYIDITAVPLVCNTLRKRRLPQSLDIAKHPSG